MIKPSVVTVRMPHELKERVAQAASQQGISTNQFITYVLTEKVTSLETQHFFESVIGHQGESEAEAAFDAVMAQVQARPVPVWDQSTEDIENRPEQIS